MIRGSDLYKYTLVPERNSDQGFYFGDSHVAVIHQGTGYFTRYWWAMCRNHHCRMVALCTQRELSADTVMCAVCSEGWQEPGYNWGQDRSMRVLDFLQEACTATYILDGFEGVQALVHSKYPKVIEPEGADLQEAEPEEP